MTTFAKSQRFWTRSPVVTGFQQSPDGLHASIVEYFNWAHDNPLSEAKPFSFQGGSWVEEIDKARVFHIKGLVVFLGITEKVWASYKERPELAQICEWAETVIYQQKFELAAADLANAGLIARDLGLSDKRELGGIPGQPLEVSARDQLLDRLSGIAAALGEGSVSGDTD